jgi:hypothetical protein
MATFYGLYVLVGIAGYAAHPLQKIQGNPLGSQDAASVSLNPRQVGSRGKRRAVGQQHPSVQIGVDALEDGLAYFYTRQHSSPLGTNHAHGAHPMGDQGLGCGVVEGLVFRQCRVDQMVDFRGQLTHGMFSSPDDKSVGGGAGKRTHRPVAQLYRKYLKLEQAKVKARRA